MRLHYRKTGPAAVPAKPSAVFIHGAGASGQLFGNQYQAFRDHTTCFFLDLPGHGQSLHPIEEVTIELYAEAVIDFVNYLPAPVVLVGHSMGGAVALSVALSNPDLVQSLVLIGTGCSLPVSNRILDGLRADYDATLDTIVRLCFSKSADPKIAAHARVEIGKTDPEIVRADFLACNAFNVCDRLHEIKMPTVIICGSKDMMTPLAFSQQLHASIPQSRLEVIPDGSHMLMVEQPEAVNGILKSAL